MQTYNRTPLTLENEIEICESYKNGYPIRPLSFKYKICIPRLKQILLKNGYKIRKSGELLEYKYDINIIKKVIEMYKSGIGMNIISRKLNIPYSQVRMFLIKSNIKLRKSGDKIYNGHTQMARVEEIKELTPLIIKDYINKMRWNDIQFKYKIGDITLKNILKENNVKYHTNRLQKDLKHDYFKIINTDKKAYFLGLIYADGTNYRERNRIGISLVKTDDYLLTLLKEEINHIGKLYDITYENPNHNPASVLSWSSKKMSKDLEKLGVVQNKSLTLRFPSEKKVPKKFLSHFLRGYFDGDGCISISVNQKNKRCYISFACSKVFAKKLKIYLEKELNIKCCLYTGKGKKISNVSCSNLNGIKKIFDFLYKGCLNVYMKRKYDKFIEYFKKRDINI